MAQELTDSFCRTDPDVARQFARVTFLSDNRADLPKVTVPTLVVQSRQDVIAPPYVGEYVRDHTPGASYALLDAVGHCPHLSAPEATVATMRAFLIAADGRRLPVLLNAEMETTPDGHFAVDGTVVGVLDSAEFATVPLLLEPGQTLVLYTDGVTEGPADSQLYGEARLSTLVAGHTGPARTCRPRCWRTFWPTRANGHATTSRSSRFTCRRGNSSRPTGIARLVRLAGTAVPSATGWEIS